MFFVRKITRAKWEKIPKDKNGNIQNDDPWADAITGCTKTTDNTLSLWLINDDSEKEVNKALTALGTNMQRCEAIDILLIPKKDIEKIFTVQQTQQANIYKEMNDFHYDIVGLKHSTLKDVADVIIEGINDKRAKRITANTMKNVLNEAIKAGKFLKEELNEKLQNTL